MKQVQGGSAPVRKRHVENSNSFANIGIDIYSRSGLQVNLQYTTLFSKRAHLPKSGNGWKLAELVGRVAMISTIFFWAPVGVSDPYLV